MLVQWLNDKTLSMGKQRRIVWWRGQFTHQQYAMHITGMCLDKSLKHAIPLLFYLKKYLLLLVLNHQQRSIVWWGWNNTHKYIYTWHKKQVSMTRKCHNPIPQTNQWHCEEETENTRWVSFGIKFTRQGSENACWIARLVERFNMQSRSRTW